MDYTWLPGGWAEEISWTITNSEGTEVCDQSNPGPSLTACCLSESEYYEVTTFHGHQ